MDSKNIKTAKVHANIAIIKYWGKKDEKLKLPLNSSISFTLDQFYTKTCIILDNMLQNDMFYLNNELQNEQETHKITTILNHFRKANQFAIIKSTNNMPTAAGLSSSSSGYAALVVAANETYNTHFNQQQLSRIARLGSGSAARSLYGPFALWKVGSDSESIAYPIQCTLDLTMIIIIISKDKKKVLSRDGMKHCVDTSTLMNTWVTQANKDAIEMLMHMQNNDFSKMGALMERNTLLMHETTQYANPPFTYLQDETFEAINIIKQLRDNGLEAYYTMDAGPNVKILCQSSDAQTIYNKLLHYYPNEMLVVSKGATDYEILEGDQT